MIDESRIMPPIAEMLEAWREHTRTCVHVPEGHDTIELTTTKGPHMTTTDFTINPPTLEVYTELDADTASMLGLDPTGRDGDPRFPYTVGKLSLEELLLLQAIANQDNHYMGELPEYAGSFLWYNVANAEVEHRLGPVATERYYEWSTVNRLTAEELIDTLSKRDPSERGPLDHVLREISGLGTE